MLRNALFPLLFLSTLAAAEPERTTVFEGGKEGYPLYRIPGLVVTNSGAVLCYCEARKSAKGDWGDIDIVLKRSEDGGKTIGPMQVIARAPKNATRNPLASKQKLGKEGEITLNNPVLIVEPAGKRIHLIYCVEYMRCFHSVSEDDGKTWGEAGEITAAFEPLRKDYPWKVLATGPAHGIALKSGRLIVPVWLSTGEGGHAHRPSAVSSLFSDDQGKTWKTGDIIAKHPELTNPSETIVLEKADGTVLFNIRHEAKPNPNRRAWSVSPDGAKGWSKVAFDDALPEPVCMGSIVRLGKPEEKLVLFCNPHNDVDRTRKNLTVKLSRDDGKTWPVSKSLEPGFAGYSDLAVGPDRTIYCLYEDGAKEKNAFFTAKLTLARFGADWLK